MVSAFLSGALADSPGAGAAAIGGPPNSSPKHSGHGDTIDPGKATGAHDWPDEGTVRVRMGVHTGEASVGEDGYVGFAVHQAARIGDLGHGGQILASRTTAALVEHELPRGLRLRDLGETRLPGLDRPEPLFQLVAEGLPDGFPPLGARRPSAA